MTYQYTEAPKNGTRYTELSGDEKQKPGPKPTGAAKPKHTVALKQEWWDYIMQWASESDPTNPSKALENYLEESRRMAPAPNYSRPRDKKGRWLPDDK